MFSLTLSHQAQVKEPNKKQKTVFREAGQNNASPEIQSLFVVKKCFALYTSFNRMRLLRAASRKNCAFECGCRKKAAGL